ncbi:DinB family protein [Candidatus Mycobacterium wuenschmannii]|uniref:DinB family protein n=1 Tax=Candidatus Mycobacterium wuenschmannii TaxID=3027808 RepID=A0ABY8VRQ1_9MYCO|nr:DinB family protein [Candidatus Mycobacterium wuenschmannii]WIM86011.1 DinB family protein [Candidatus Mycobacterium wuenschmannii]
MDWTTELVDQLRFHWETALRPRFESLSDAEYHWEPVPGCWGVRARGQQRSEGAAGGGETVIDFAFPQPEPPPVTTIAWRLGHIIVGVFGMRAASYFGGPAMDYGSFRYAATAAEGLAQLDAGYARWTAGVAALDADELARPCGPAEGPYADKPMATLILHIHREAIHHGAEIALLRDLYAGTQTGGGGIAISSA